MNKNLTDPSKVEEAYAEGKTHLEVVEMLVKFYSVYPPKTKKHRGTQFSLPCDGWLKRFESIV